ncbi:hypothetical protein ACFFX0_31790 [Citricoccus parietis]|uniref:Uncharacterized protein n=1 Tax=Citricoccus parietis TaxID=592307 RepID=A0ABV5GA66_9MICC
MEDEHGEHLQPVAFDSGAHGHRDNRAPQQEAQGPPHRPPTSGAPEPQRPGQIQQAQHHGDGGDQRDRLQGGSEEVLQAGGLRRDPDRSVHAGLIHGCREPWLSSA